ncbi:HIT family protein [Frankia sp. Hr75.2]|nr:HIT family protein [Frankia sp. Hr75.2]
MRLLEESGTCLFCPPQMDLEPARGLVLATEHWVVRHNDYGYRGTRLHLMAIPRRHVIDLVDLPDDALAEFWRVVRDVRDRYGLRFYGLGARCGDCAYTGGTIAHVHTHIVVGDVEDPAHEAVRLKLSSRPPSSP